MKSWELRQPEAANLFNPAFVGLLIYKAALKYREAAGKCLPYSLAFLIPPIVLHPQTVKTIRLGQGASFQKWANENQPTKIGFAARARNLVPHIRESLLFLVRSGVISILEDASLSPNAPVRLIRRKHKFSETDALTIKHAETLGRWFAEGGTSATIYATLGVKP